MADYRTFLLIQGWTDQKLLKMMDSETHSAYKNPHEKKPQSTNLKKIKEEARRPLRCCNLCNCCCYMRKQLNNQPPPVPPGTAVVNAVPDDSVPDAPPPTAAIPPQTTQHTSRPRIRRECTGGDNLTPKVRCIQHMFCVTMLWLNYYRSCTIPTHGVRSRKFVRNKLHRRNRKNFDPAPT